MQATNVTSGTFLSRVEECLAARGWTKTELSRQLGITHPAVLKWWQGQIPRSGTLMKMAELFQVRPDWLVSGAGEKLDWAETVKEASARAQELEGKADIKQVIFDLDIERERVKRLEAEKAELNQKLDDMKKTLRELLKED